MTKHFFNNDGKYDNTNPPIGKLVTGARAILAAVVGLILTSLYETLKNSPLYHVMAMTHINATQDKEAVGAYIGSAVPKAIRSDVGSAWQRVERYLDGSSKYSLLAETSRPLAVMVNALRVLSDKASAEQIAAFNFGETTATDIATIHGMIRTATVEANGWTAQLVAAFLATIPAGDSQALATFFGAEGCDQTVIEVVGYHFEERTAGSRDQLAGIGVNPAQLWAEAQQTHARA